MLTTRFNNSTPKSLEEIFDDLFTIPMMDSKFLKTSSYKPAYDIIENENEYIIEMELSGIPKENIQIEIEKNEMKISGEKIENKELRYVRKQLFYGKFEKTFKLSDDINVENITSKYIDGILKINIPKTNNKTTIKKMIDIR